MLSNAAIPNHFSFLHLTQNVLDILGSLMASVCLYSSYHYIIDLERVNIYVLLVMSVTPPINDKDLDTMTVMNHHGALEV